ncbi:maleylpyruvate isomerase family mycothiol-dependent enzyme [Streptomyces abyssomicinicus]|uniref:maleylpyruvate isomerase family mycothiol-dependent enzyme n=1 Tax=Streptomyces abyssomicinicus TaxID=574929 RepID=UPI001250421D|nr:maleylpyruvate isomerase family mycothiol-dependent enzyme [Streptomyces abyssomicinicus]
MKIAEHIEILRREGELLAGAAEEAGLGAPVPTCPGWRVRDLVEHTGAVHRWAAAFVGRGLTAPRQLEAPPHLDGAELLAWFTEGHRELTSTLASADPEVECWRFLPAPSPLAFWARRQAHETAVHRLDAEAARGGEPTEVGAEFAVDGIDELLRGFHGRRKRWVRSPEPRLLRVRVTDVVAAADPLDASKAEAEAAAEAVWTVRISEDPPVTVRGAGGDGVGGAADAVADCELAGPAAQLYAALWNRSPYPSVSGDAGTAELWREQSKEVLG